MNEIELPDAEEFTERLIATAVSAVMNEPRLAGIRDKLTGSEIRRIALIIVEATALLAAKEILKALSRKSGAQQ